MKKYIHVNQHVIRSNKKNNENEPVITVKEGRKNTYCHEVIINGPSRVRYGGNDKQYFHVEHVLLLKQKQI